MCNNNRIDKMFAKQLSRGKKALITFVTAGDPDLETTRQLVLKMEQSGADLIELGVPYSDPIAEGPVIQEANIRALKNDVRLAKLFEFVSSLRKETDIPIVFLLYVNCILQYGKTDFFEACLKHGIDGVIIPDLPFEESDEINDEAQRTGVRLIRLVAPSSENRIEMIAARAQGFLYCVSSLGVTGMRSNFATDFNSFFERINKTKSAPSAVGFGISTPEQANELKAYCDGIIVGSAIVKKIATASNGSEAVSLVAEFVSSLRKALDE